MDSEKLLRILTDLLKDEQNIGIDGKLSSIRDRLSENTSESFTTAESQLDELLKQIQEISTSFKYSQSEYLILDYIKGTRCFGRGLVRHLEKIFSSRSFEIIRKIDELRNQRNDLIQKITSLSESLTAIGISEYRPDFYEVGLLLPETENDIDSLQKYIKNLDMLLSSLSEGASGKHSPIKITRVSNGTLEFFSLQPVEVAALLTTLLSNIILIWEKIEKFKKKISEFEEDDEITQESKIIIKKALQKETDMIKEQILTKLPEEFLKNLEKERANEIRNKIGISIKAIFAWFEFGIQIDITPVRIPVDPNVQQDPEKNTTNTLIENTTKKLQQIYQLPPEQRKLPFKIPDYDEKTTEKK